MHASEFIPVKKANQSLNKLLATTLSPFAPSASKCSCRQPPKSIKRITKKSLNVFSTKRNRAQEQQAIQRKRFYSTYAPTLKKITLTDLKKKYHNNTPLTMVTAYDYTSAINVDKAEIDMILVGDSLGMVMLGLNNTSSVTMDDMIHHSKAVTRAVKSAFVVGDMPFGSYEASPTEAVKNAIRLVKEGNVEAVKMEGGVRIKEAVKAVVAAGIPVIGHIGLTPQTANALGGFKVQAKTASAAQQLLEDALELQNCGVSGIVIEAVPELVATYVTKKLQVPTIGIGAGAGCSGQVLVYHDMMGLYPHFTPKFCKQYAQVGATIQEALVKYREEVTSKAFPAQQHTFNMKREDLIQAFPDAEQLLPVTPISATPAQPTDVSDNASNSPLPIFHVAKEKKKTIAVIGGGAMGSLVSGRIASTGDYNVWMISSWKEHVEKINSSGLKLRNLDKSTQQVNFRATTEVDDFLAKSGEQADLAVILVKSPQTKQAATVASKVIRPRDGLVLTLQNGLGNREIIEEVVGDESRVIQGVTSQGSFMVDSGMVWHTGHGSTTLAANKLSPFHIKEVAAMLSKSGIPCDVTENLESMIWGKLIVNAGINPLTALLRVKNGVIASSTACREILSETVKEGVSVATARGTPIPYKSHSQALEAVLSVARATSENMSSMLVDVMRGSETEIDFINGAIVREGDRLGVPVRYNKLLCNLISLPSISGGKVQNLL